MSSIRFFYTCFQLFLTYDSLEILTHVAIPISITSCALKNHINNWFIQNLMINYIIFELTKVDTVGNRYKDICRESMQN